MKFSTRLIVGAVGIVLVTVMILIAGSARGLGRDLEEAFAQELERQARLIAAAVADRPDDLNAVAHDLGTVIGRRVTFLTESGQVVGDSDFSDRSLRLLEDHSDRPEVIDALGGAVGIASRLSASTNRVELKVAVAAWPGVVRVSAPVEQVRELVSGAAAVTIVAGLIATVIGVLLAVLGGRAIARPIGQLARASVAVSQDASPSFPTSSIPEIRDLVRAFSAMHRDLDARMGQLRREREETSALIESMAEGVIACDAAGSVVLCNGAMRELLGFKGDDPIPGIAELFHQRDAREVIDAVRAGRPVASREVEIGKRAVLMTGQRLETGGAVFGALDVTDARRVHVVRRDFVANVSHELKTPLTSILGYTDTLIAGSTDAETRESFLNVIHNNARRMQALVDDLLDLARFESGAWEPKPEAVDVSSLARDAWRAVARLAAERGVSFEANVEPGFTVVADRDALQHIFTNLFDNAVRHTPAGGTITAGVRRESEFAVVSVRDTGSGIPAEHVDRVFERFYRVDPGRSRAEGGTGLGLAIVKHLTEAHGGTVRIESRVGQGTAIIMHFPLAA